MPSGAQPSHATRQMSIAKKFSTSWSSTAAQHSGPRSLPITARSPVDSPQ